MDYHDREVSDAILDGWEERLELYMHCPKINGHLIDAWRDIYDMAKLAARDDPGYNGSIGALDMLQIGLDKLCGRDTGTGK